MASTPRYAISSDHENYADSSPDPLGASFDENQARAAHSRVQPLASTSPSKQNRRSNVAHLELSSPTKQMLLNTPRTAGQSPWRIKVTVQAEPGSDSENLESPIIKHVTSTRTTKIPLKDPDAPSPVKRRGRPRKSDVATKRSGTPVRRRLSSTARRSSGGEASAADVETDGTPKRRRGRPKKTLPAADEDDIWGQARRSSVGAHLNEPSTEIDASPRKRRGRPRKSIQLPLEDALSSTTEQSHCSTSLDEFQLEEPVNITTEPDPESVAPTSLPPQESPSLLEPAPPTPQVQETRRKSTPITTETSPRLEVRKNTPLSKEPAVVYISSDESTEQETDVGDEPSISRERDQHTNEEPAIDGVQFDAAQAPTIEFEDVDGEEYEGAQFPFDEGATRMPDDTTVIDSENFSMISVDSLPSCASVNKSVKSVRSINGPRSSPVPTHITLPLPQDPRSAGPRYKTPSVEPMELSMPPPVESARPDPAEAQTPRIGRVVKAGVALQGLLDPERATPETRPSDAHSERHDQLDDLFRGFSERTRRELHAGLRLGEQLAQQTPSSQALSSPLKAMRPALHREEHVVSDEAQQQHRLLTPEDHEGDISPPALETDVEYPTLGQSDHSGLLSPVSSTEHDRNETGEPDDHLQEGGPSQSAGTADIWEEEASRSLVAPASEHGQTEDLLETAGPAKSARGNLHRIRRRKNGGSSRDSDEAEESQIATPPSTESDESSASCVEPINQSQSKTHHLMPTKLRDDEEASEDSDDTGTFFQANMPSLYNRNRSAESRRGRGQRSEISLHLEESLLPESSPMAASKTTSGGQRNPFLDTPPQLAALSASPGKSSPLRRELHSSDLSSEAAHESFEESTLPLAPSSPFHTIVEGDTAHSMASDQRQFMQEMAGTDSSFRRIRDEADDYLEAYEPQERELEDLTEMTEPSRTWHRNTTMLASSPPKPSLRQGALRSNLGQSAIPAAQSPLSGHQNQTLSSPHAAFNPPPNKAHTPIDALSTNKESAQFSTPLSAVTPETSSPTMRRTTSPPPVHPALKKLAALPRVEPWTKTHYKALDRLYQLYKKQPSIFSPTSAPNSALNSTLLTNILNSTTRNFIGSRYRCWGYNVIFTDALVVLVAAFMQLLTLSSMEEFEAKSGQEISMGEWVPGRDGVAIGVEGVCERLATIVLGEAVRRDEKRGKVIDKSGRLRVEWAE